MISQELALKLKDAGWPQSHDCIDGNKFGNLTGACLCVPAIPTLEELIEACGDKFHCLVYQINGGINSDRKFWSAGEDNLVKNWHNAQTPSEAVANLWLALNEKK